MSGTTRSARLAVCALAFAAGAAGLTGCGGGGRGNLSGKVTYNGQPVTSGTVQVFAPDGTTYTGPIGTDGAYQVNDIPAGDVKIGVSSPDPQEHYNTLKGFARTDGQKESLKEPDPAVLSLWFPIPETLQSPDESGLTAKIKRGDNQQDLAMTGPTLDKPKRKTTATKAPPSRGGVKQP